MVPESRKVDIIVGDLQPALSPGSFTGRLEVRVDGTSFPGPGWNDFVFPVLTLLVGAAATAQRGTPSEVSFMDGPFRLRFEAVGDGLRVQGFEDRLHTKRRRLLDSRCPYWMWVDAFREARDAVLEPGVLTGLSPETPEVERLGSAVLRLEQTRHSGRPDNR